MNLTCLLVFSALTLNAQSSTISNTDLSNQIQSQFLSLSIANPNLNEKEMASKIVDSLECDNPTAVKDEISKAFRNLEKYDYIIGSPFGDITEITLGQNEQYDFLIHKVLSKYISIACPGYLPKNHISGISNIPDQTSSTYNKDIADLKMALSQNQMTLNEATSLLLQDTESQENKDVKIRYFETYDFSRLDTLLDGLNRQLVAVCATNTIVTVGSFILGVLCPITLIATIPVNLASWGVFAAFETDFLNKLNDYEMAVINAHSSIYKKPVNAMLIKDKPIAKSLEYFSNEYINNEDNLVVDYNNALDAYRHTYWNALMCYEFGRDAAKDMADAHEYFALKNGEIDSIDEMRALDMDLKNNEAGRNLGIAWPYIKDRLMYNHRDYSIVPDDNWDALAFYTLKIVSEGSSSANNVYTFASDTGLGQTNSGKNLDSIEGLKNTNFDLDKILGDDSYKYFVFHPYC